jgi:hypothetical protein
MAEKNEQLFFAEAIFDAERDAQVLGSAGAGYP